MKPAIVASAILVLFLIGAIAIFVIAKNKSHSDQAPVLKKLGEKCRLGSECETHLTCCNHRCGRKLPSSLGGVCY